MSERDEKLRWFVPASEEEVETLIAGEWAAAWRMALAIVPVLLVIWWPMRAWLTLALGASPALTRLCGWLSGLGLIAPLAFLAQAALHRWMSRRLLGTTYRVNDQRIRWGDKLSAFWHHLVAYRDDGVRRGGDGRPRVTLVRTGGRTHVMPLSDDPAVVAAMRAMLAARLPRYDPSTHGPIDVPAELPGWTVALLVSSCVLFVAATLWAAQSVVNREAMRTLLFDAQLGAMGVGVVWYWAVRCTLNARQRDRALGAVVATFLGLWVVAMSAMLVPMAIRVTRDLRAIPPDVRARVSVSIPSAPHRR